jgi:hypothetical protein
MSATVLAGFDSHRAQTLVNKKQGAHLLRCIIALVRMLTLKHAIGVHNHQAHVTVDQFSGPGSVMGFHCSIFIKVRQFEQLGTATRALVIG